MAKKICVWGDSVGCGCYDFKNGGWVHILKMYLWQKFNGEVEVMDLSIDGETSAGVFKRFAEEYKFRQPNIALVAIGMNDAVFDKRTKNNWVKKENTKKNLQKIIEVVKKNNQQIVLIGLTKIKEDLLTPVEWDKNLFYYKDNIKKYNAIIKMVAKENNIPFIPMFDVLEDEDLDDGLHPNADGHRKMFERIRDFLEEEKIIGK
jgi:acyl-CoA thioesterase-1